MINVEIQFNEPGVISKEMRPVHKATMQGIMHRHCCVMGAGQHGIPEGQ